ncbi:calcineurin-like phosphoesterase C-terminal domain-containing protein [Thermomonas sp.]|uniref:calcineurin-like phosphoesterase C-terminal domain-containing protein n=1 Tax=Thermomonas sp. TaxID=1971895 RepID=UPI0024882BEB|nr:calcineurin-like phosphoesterase C-terminal domain-containing protein [Thermomonas sp.]MDI1252959.1 calcineurin-like phosphoesterase C-terminal domain-containing protein [Thermomonas sp.]
MRTMVALIPGCMSVVMLVMAGSAQARVAECTPVVVESGNAQSRTTVVRTSTACIRYIPQPAAPAPDTPLEVLVFGDPQPKSAVDADYFRRDIVEPLRGRQQAALGLSLGDIVSDAPAVYPLVKAATAELGLPWMYLPGNHDIDADATGDADSLRSFHQAFGADTHARETTLATFIALDDVIALPGRKPAYIGGFRKDQFAFLEAYLPTLRKDRLLVLAVHIPLFEEESKDSFRDADRAHLFELLRDFPHLLVLSAHSHSQQHVFHDAGDGWNGAQPLHEYNIGAACGAYWSGIKDSDGIPDATMADGTPNGYAVLTVQAGGTYALAWHNARDVADTQIGLHAPKVLRRGAYPAWGVYANVYMGMDDSRVEYRVDGGDWAPMRKLLQPDPALLAENMRDDAADALRGYDRSPEAEPSRHLWRAALPTTLAVGEHKIEVRTFDRWRGELRATTSYRLEDAAP